jgi:hypothetical protein
MIASIEAAQLSQYQSNMAPYFLSAYIVIVKRNVASVVVDAISEVSQSSICSTLGTWCVGCIFGDKSCIHELPNSKREKVEGLILLLLHTRRSLDFDSLHQVARVGQESTQLTRDTI